MMPKINADPSEVKGAPHASAAWVDNCRALSWWALLASALLIPSAFGNFQFLGFGTAFTNDSFLLLKVVGLRVLTLVSLAAWACALALGGGRVRRTRLDPLIIAFLLIVGASVVFSVHMPTAIFGKYNRDEGLLAFVNYAVLYFLGVQHIDRPARVRALALAIVAGSIPVVAYGVIQYLGLDPIPWSVDFGPRRAFSTYGNPDILGGFLMFTVPVSLVLAFFEKRPVLRVLLWAAFALNLFVLVVSFTRGAWVGGLVGLAFAGFVAFRHGARFTRIDAIPALVSGALLAVLLRVQHLAGADVEMGIVQFGAYRLTAGDAGGIGARLLIWKAAIAAIAERPLLGFGPDTFRFVFGIYKPLEYVRTISANVADSPHSYPLQMAVGVGVVGAVLLYYIFARVAVGSGASVFRSSVVPERAVLGSLWAGCAGYIAYLFFGLSVPGVAFLLWLAMAALMAPSAKSVDVQPARNGGGVAVVVIALGVTLIALQVPVVRADAAYLQANKRTNSNAPEDALEAVRLNPFVVEYRYQVPFTYTNRALGLLSAAGSSALDPASLARVRDDMEAAEAGFESAIEFCPDYYPSYRHFATLLNISGDVFGGTGHERAAEIARRGKRLDPSASAIRLELAYALQATGKADEAIAELEDSLIDVPGDVGSAVTLAELYVGSGDTTAALRVLEAANNVNPDQPELLDAIKNLK